MGSEKWHYFSHSRPALRVIVWRRWPKNTPWRRFQFTCWPRNSGGIGGIHLIIDNTRPHGAIAGKIHPFHIIPSESATGQKGLSGDIQGGCAAHIRHTLTAQVSIGGNTHIGRHTQGLVTLPVRSHNNAQPHGPPLLFCKLKNTLLGKVSRHTIGRKLHPTTLQGQEARNVILAGQNTQVGVVVIF